MPPQTPPGSSQAGGNDSFLPHLPGYEVQRLLGEGGSGKVYRAVAPGGYAKAVKIVVLDKSNPLTEREMQGLELIRSIRHPYLLSIDRMDVGQNRITIVMELADCNLRDEYERYLAAGMPGIPRDILLPLLGEAAEVLDLFNLQHNVQHMDIKPENLFLVAGHMKVGDYGLVRRVDGNILESKDNAITPGYAAPEMFNGNVSRSCDQYSLAVVYMEMLTGQRPYPSNNVRQLAFQHLTKPPDVSTLSGPDQEVLLRAFSRSPADRFDSCKALIAALREHKVYDARFSKTGAPIPADQMPQAAKTVKSNTQKMGATAPVTGGPDSQANYVVNWYSVEVPAAIFMTKMQYFADNWGGAMSMPDPQTAVLEFETRTSWLRSLMGKKNRLTMLIRFYQRDSQRAQSLIEATISCPGSQISEQTFMEYTQALQDVLQRDLSCKPSSPQRVRRDKRLKLQNWVLVIVSEGSAPLPCSVMDVSARGLRLSSSCALPMGNVRVRLPGMEELLPATIVRCNKEGQSYDVGVSFPFEPNYPKEFLGGTLLN